MFCLKIPKFVLMSLAIQVLTVYCENYIGVAFSPYVKNNAPRDSYTMEEIKQMLKIILKNHNVVSTYSMGVSQENKRRPWYRAESNCLIARAAAEINRDFSNSNEKLSIFQGIYQNVDLSVQNREIENAFTAAADANSIWSRTVRGLIFTHEYVGNSNGKEVLEMIVSNKERAHSMGLAVGTRIDICHQINGGSQQQMLKEIARESDFIMCDLYPTSWAKNTARAIQEIAKTYREAKNGFLKANRYIDVIIGETGWASEGKSFNNVENSVRNQQNFWLKIKEWATYERVKVQMFETFDQPSQNSGYRHFGRYYRPDRGAYFIDKFSGKKIQ